MTEALALFLSLLPFAGVWATWKLWGWALAYHSRFLWGLFWASLVSDVAALPVAVISVRRLLTGPDAPPFPNAGELLGFSLILLETIFVFLVFRWRDLDREPPNEEDNQ